MCLSTNTFFQLTLPKCSHSFLFFFGLYCLRLCRLHLKGVFQRLTKINVCPGENACLSLCPKSVPRWCAVHLSQDTCFDELNPFSKLLLFFPSSNTFVISMMKSSRLFCLTCLAGKLPVSVRIYSQQSQILWHEFCDVQEMPVAKPTCLCPITQALPVTPLTQARQPITYHG